jgi:hypothetical protein
VAASETPAEAPVEAPADHQPSAEPQAESTVDAINVRPTADAVHAPIASRTSTRLSKENGKGDFTAAAIFFDRVALQLTRAEDGIIALRFLFVKTCSPELWVGLEENERRNAEHETLLKLLVDKLQLRDNQAEDVLDDVYEQLGLVFGAIGPRCLCMRSNPQALAAFKADGKPTLAPLLMATMTRRSSSDRAVETATRIAAIRLRVVRRSQEEHHRPQELPPLLFLS